MLDEAERGKPLQHRGRGGGRHAHILRDFAGPDGLDLTLQPPDSLDVLLDGFGELALVALAPIAGPAGRRYAKMNLFNRHMRISARIVVNWCAADRSITQRNPTDQ